MTNDNTYYSAIEIFELEKLGVVDIDIENWFVSYESSLYLYWL